MLPMRESELLHRSERRKFELERMQKGLRLEEKIVARRALHSSRFTQENSFPPHRKTGGIRRGIKVAPSSVMDINNTVKRGLSIGIAKVADAVHEVDTRL